MLVNKLEGLNKAQSFINAAANGTVILCYLHNNACTLSTGLLKASLWARNHQAQTLWVDDEKAPDGVTSSFNDHVLVLRHSVSQIGNEGNVERSAKTSVLARCVHPCQVRVLAIYTHAYHLFHHHNNNNKK